MKASRIFLSLLLAALVAGCASWGENIGNGASKSVQTHADTIAFNLVSGLIRGVNDTGNIAKLNHMLDSVFTTIGINSSKQLAIVLDTAIGSTTNARIKSILVTARAQIDTLRDSLLGESTARMIKHLISDVALGPSTQNQITKLLHSILGDSTKHQINALLDAVISQNMTALRDTLFGPTTLHRIDSVLSHVQGATHEEQSFLQKNVTTILWTAGGIVAGIIALCAYFYIRKRRADRMLEVVTSQIHYLPDPNAKQTLTQTIKQKSLDAGTEVHLHEFLDKRGLLNSTQKKA